MNLLIAILSDAYELVQSEQKYYDGKAKLHRSLMYERIYVFFLRLLKKEEEQKYLYLFVSMPVNFEEDADIEDEGMIGKIINDARKNHSESKDAVEKNQISIKEA